MQITKRNNIIYFKRETDMDMKFLKSIHAFYDMRSGLNWSYDTNPYLLDYESSPLFKLVHPTLKKASKVSPIKEYSMYDIRRKLITNEWDKNYNFERLNWDHIFKIPPNQVQYVSFLKAVSFFQSGNFNEMGLGKTKVAVDFISFFIEKGVAKTILIVCIDSLVDHWLDEIALNSFYNWKSIIIKGNKEERLSAINKYSTIHLIGFTALRNTPEITQKNYDILIVDESHKVKNIKSKTFKVLSKVAPKIPLRLLLTGTPMTKGPEDLVAQYRIMDGGLTFGYDIRKFKNKFFELKGPRAKFKTEYADHVRKLMLSKAVQFKMKDVKDMPPQIFKKVSCYLSPEQEEFYQQVIDQPFFREKALPNLIKLSQIVQGAIVEDGVVAKILDSNKLRLTMNLLENMVMDYQYQTLVFCQYLFEMPLIAKECEKLGISYHLMSGQNLKERPKVIKDFKEQKVQVLIAQLMTGSTGLDFPQAKTIIFYSVGLKWGDFTQACGRIYRLSQTDTTYYFIPYVKYSVDEAILKLLERKEDVIRMIETGNVNLDKMARGEI